METTLVDTILTWLVELDLVKLVLYKNNGVLNNILPDLEGDPFT